MFSLLKYTKGKDIWLTFISFVLIAIQTACDVAQPFLLAFFLKKNDTNDGFWIREPNNPIGGIGGLAGITFGLIIFGLVCQVIGIVVTARVGVRIGSNIRYAAFKHIQSLTFKEIDEFTTPSLITRLTNDIMFYQNTLIIALRIFLRSVLLIIGGIIGTFVLGTQIGLWWVGLVFMAFMILVSASIFLILKKSVPYFRKQQTTLDHMNGVMRENLLGVRVVKAFNMQDEQIDKFKVENAELSIVSITASRWATSIIPAIYFIVQISVVVILMLIPALSKPDSNIDATFILQIIQLTSLVVLGIILIVAVLIQLAYLKASSDRINEVFKAKPSIARNVNDIKIEKPNILFNDVSFKYHNTDESENALSNITFDAHPGEMIGIIGPTGSGKTTLINLITRMYDVTNGEILISGKNIKQIDYESLRESIGVSPQKSLLFSGTIASNLKFGKEDATEDEMVEASTKAQAMEFINSKEGKFDAVVEQRGTNLSGGQKQRLSIARALIKKPKILILDDSTSALDMITEAKVQDAIRKQKHVTTFLIGQRISAISKADKIIVLDKGKMVGYGSHNNLMKNCSLYKDIAISQGFGK